MLCHPNDILFKVCHDKSCQANETIRVMSCKVLLIKLLCHVALIILFQLCHDKSFQTNESIHVMSCKVTLIKLLCHVALMVLMIPATVFT